MIEPPLHFERNKLYLPLLLFPLASSGQASREVPFENCGSALKVLPAEQSHGFPH